MKEPVRKPRETPSAKERESNVYPAEKARQGEIILRTPLRKAIFLGGLAAFVLLAVIFGMLSLR